MYFLNSQVTDCYPSSIPHKGSTQNNNQPFAHGFIYLLAYCTPPLLISQTAPGHRHQWTCDSCGAVSREMHASLVCASVCTFEYILVRVFRYLHTIDVSENKLEGLMDEMASLKHCLRHLLASSNSITALPPDIGR